MPRLTITIDTDNASFNENEFSADHEIAVILKNLSNAIAMRGINAHSGIILDANGNTCGRLSYDEATDPTPGSQTVEQLFNSSYSVISDEALDEILEASFQFNGKNTRLDVLFSVLTQETRQEITDVLNATDPTPTTQRP